VTGTGLLELALEAATAAGSLLLERAGGPVSGLSSKSSRTDLVSDADRDAEALILRAIRAERPGDAITAEEGGGGEGGSGLRWLVDPLDGTINYLWNVPHWCVSIAARDGEGTLVAVVHDPSRGETFQAWRGGGARLGDAALAMAEGPPLGEALVGTGFEYRVEERARQAARLATVLPRVRDVRRFGAAALDLAWLAAGRLDGFYESSLNPWDWAAGDLLVREAGGVVHPLPPRGVVAAGPGLIGPLRELVAVDEAASG
jgi:myo-inositol-1(or 4)-monophosphatase